MKLIQYNDLKSIVEKICLQLDFSDEDADLIAAHLATSNLFGHHSHGVIRLPEYFRRVTEGLINPAATPTVEDYSPCIAFVDGHSGLGHPASFFAANLAIDKARTTGLAAIGINNISHTGRLGAYVEQIAQANMLGIYFCNGKSKIKIMAPYGSKDPKIAANPLAYSAPRKQLPPIVLDMATTAIAQGKILNANNKNEKLANNDILDKQGNPSNDPHDFFNGGSILPFGGDQAYKGFGLALFVEIFSGILSKAKMLSTENRQDNNAGFMMAINIEHFLPLDVYFEEIEALCDDLKGSQLRQGFSEILLPGERSNKIAEQQTQQGIQIDQQSWQNLQTIARELGVEV